MTVDPFRDLTPVFNTASTRKEAYDQTQQAKGQLTAPQRVVELGTGVPVVFCREEAGRGGVWLTPPAIRLGYNVDSINGSSFAFALAISQGELGGTIEEADIYQGKLKLASLTDNDSVVAYGYEPVDGYNYQITYAASDIEYGLETKVYGPLDTVIPVTGTNNQYLDIVSVGTRTYYNLKEGEPYAYGQIIPFTYEEGLIDTRGYVVSFSELRVSKDGTDYLSTYNIWADDFKIFYSAQYVHTNVQLGNPNINLGNTKPPALLVRGEGTDPWPDGAEIVAKDLYFEHTVRVALTPTYLGLFAGSGGSFEDLTVLAVKGKYSARYGADIYNQQVRCFVRHGIKVTKLLGGTNSSDNFADLAKYLLSASGKVSDSLIDIPSFVSAAVFTINYDMRFNGVLSEQTSLMQYLVRTAPMFLLQFCQVGGKFALKPLLPVDSSGRISTEPITAKYVFDKSNIIVDSYARTYVEARDRKAFRVLTTWRDQGSYAYSVTKSANVAYSDSTIDDTQEQYDMQSFCAYQRHAQIVGAYILAKRRHTTHAVSFETTAYDCNLAPTDVIQITWDYATPGKPASESVFMYQVDSIQIEQNGRCTIEATHFPVTETGVSVIALDTLVA